MTVKNYSPEELLGFNKFYLDEEHPHIEIDETICATCQEKPCLYICSAVCYKLSDAGEIQFDYAGCLECGTCRIVCRELGQGGVVKWVYPHSTFGINFRYG